MSDSLETLLTQYENGQISRRGFLAALSAVALAGASGATQAQDPGLQVTSLNHATLFVDDVARTAALYQQMLGMPVMSNQGNGVNLAAGGGNQFVGIFNGPPGPPRIDHLCFGVKDLNVENCLDVLKAHGLEGRVRMRDETAELYFSDPNGITLQLQDENYCGGGGPLGDQCEDSA